MIIHACVSCLSLFHCISWPFSPLSTTHEEKGVYFHDFCCMFVCSTYCHLISRGKGVTKGWGIQLWLGHDLLVIYVYYLVWNLKWNAMCLPIVCFYHHNELGVVIDVINNQAWDKATTQSWSLIMSWLMFNLLKHIE
jgi:hypothetical protein